MRFGIFYLMTNASFSSQSYLFQMFDVWWLNYHYYKSHTVLFFITQLWFMSKLIWQMKWFKSLYWPRLSTSKSNLKLTPYLMSTTNSSISSFLITTPTAPPPLKSPSLKCFFYSFICCFERPVQQDNELLRTHFCGEGNPNDGSIVLWKIKATQIRGSLKSSRLCFCVSYVIYIK